MILSGTCCLFVRETSEHDGDKKNGEEEEGFTGFLDVVVVVVYAKKQADIIALCECP